MKILAGRYRLEEPTGHGGMAVVHRAYDTVLRRTVAIKMLPPERCWDSAFRAAVQREARAAAQLCHPNIASVHDYGETTLAGTTQPFVVLEFVTGGTLADRLQRKGPLPWREAAGICAGVAAGLAAAHAHQLVHRDIKPANVMLSPAGVKVVDFGVATMAGQAAADDDGRMWGTPAYLAPEQLRHDTVSPAADVYAVGLLLHVCLTGRPPWPGDNATQVLTARRRQTDPESAPPARTARGTTATAARLPRPGAGFQAVGPPCCTGSARGRGRRRRLHRARRRRSTHGHRNHYDDGYTAPNDPARRDRRHDPGSCDLRRPDRTPAHRRTGRARRRPGHPRPDHRLRSQLHQPPRR